MARIDTKNSTHYWEDRHIPGLSLLRADLTTLEYAPHTHEAFVIAVTEIGGAEIRNHGRLARVHASTLFVSNPMEPQSARLAGSRRWCYRSFYIAQPASMQSRAVSALRPCLVSGEALSTIRS